MPIHIPSIPQGSSMVNYGREIEDEIAKLQQEITRMPALAGVYNSRWLAIKLLEEDENIHSKVENLENASNLLEKADHSISHLRDIFGDDVDTVIADRRYGWINGLMRETVRRTHADRLAVSDRIDRIVTNRFLGIPIFLALMWIMFKFITDVAAPLLDWVDGVISGPITQWVSALLGWTGLGDTWVESLFVNGIIAGVGGVLVFVPVLMFLYMGLALLEDSGYMARAAFVMDRLMHVLGLHGKSFLPMIVGFGCTVPALYATRTLENEKDRILTGLLVPFMSCGARLPVYVLFASVFFPENTGVVIFSMYLLGIVIAILVGVLLKRFVFKGKQESPFVMELPPYRMPTFRGIWFHMWERTSGFIRKAWTIILAASVVIWLLLAIPLSGDAAFAEAEVEKSLFAGISGAIAPAFEPLGFGEWEASGSIITGFIAKEIVVSSLSQAYGVEEMQESPEATTFFEDLGDILIGFLKAIGDTIKSIPLIVGIDLFEAEEEQAPTGLMQAVRENFEVSSNGHGALASFAFMVFILLYTPCMVAVAAERQELGAKWMWVSIIGQTGLAWLAAFLIFQGGLLLGIG